MIELVSQNLLILIIIFLDGFSRHILKMNSKVLKLFILRYCFHRFFHHFTKFINHLFLYFFKLNSTDISILLLLFELFLFIFILKMD